MKIWILCSAFQTSTTDIVKKTIEEALLISNQEKPSIHVIAIGHWGQVSNKQQLIQGQKYDVCLSDNAFEQNPHKLNTIFDENVKTKL